jgi:iron complex transport system permease protein
MKRGHRGTAGYFAVAFAVLALLLVISFSVGKYSVSVSELLRLLWFKILGAPSGLPETAETVVFKVRGPRVLASMIVGGALAVSGAVYQGLFRNPLVSPDILGVSSGASLGAVLGIYFYL